MRRCGRKKGLLMVESSGCAAFGHPAAAQGSLSDDHREETWAAEASRSSRIRRDDGARSSRCPCRARLVSLAAGASRVPPAADWWQLIFGRSCEPSSCEPSSCELEPSCLATTAVSREKLRPRLRCRTVTGRTGQVATTDHVTTTGHATTARRETNPSQQHRVAERRHEPRLRIPRQPGGARWPHLVCRKGPSIQPQSGRFLVAPFRIAREATMDGRAPACRHESIQCPTKC